MTTTQRPVDELFRIGAQRTFRGRQLAEIAFPLGGIGTGTVCLGGRGNLCDWEIFNRPNKGYAPPWAFFAIRACRDGGEPILRILEAPKQPPFNGQFHGKYDGTGFGVPRSTGAGLPHMREAQFTGAFPFANVEFSDPDLPVTVSLEAWNPTIPHNADNSGIPIAILTWTITNPCDEAVEVTLVGNLPAKATPGEGQISVRQQDGITALQVMFNAEQPTASNYGTLALATPWRETTYETHWLRASWYTPLTDWGKHLLATGRLHDVTEPAAEGNDVGSLGLRVRLSPGESVKLPVFLCWSFPNYEKTWQQCNCQGVCSKPQWKNYYAHQFPDAWTAACYTNKNFDRLERETRLFQQTLFSSTLPAVVLDAVSSQMSIIKSTTCLRLPDGTFYGFEGCHGDEGCCEGSCTHVWQYAQTHAFLYPELERSMREAEYRYSMFPDGKVCFRLQLPLGAPPTDFHACADGQMGAIMQVYRDWQLGAGDSWLRSVWPAVKRSMEYAWIVWDIDQDGLMEGIQHNTYDIEFHGPNPLCGVLYLGALRAAGRMAAYLGEDDFAKLCGDVEARGAVALDAALYNGEYYIQQYDPASGLEHQFGTGCLVDQLLGQQLAHVFGLGYLLPQDHTRQSVASIYRYNFHTDFWNHMNYERIFALNDEAGTVICTWPHGGRPEVPFTYCDEVMIGFEYQLASHLIYEGLVEEGLRVTQAVRDRHDGERRNPWNEFECGNHYARSMANWAVKLALDGFTYSAQQGLIGFAPKVNAAAFQTFWSTGTGWGEYRQCLAERHFRLSVLHGEQHIQQLELADLPDGDVLINVGENRLPAERKDKRIILTEPVILRSGDALDVLVTPRG